MGYSPRQCVLGSQINPPLVVKPRAAEYAAARPGLQRVADEFEEVNSHYRFFAYSEGSISTDEAFNGTDAWRAGTSGTMCSSSLWTAFQNAGVHREGVVEHVDWTGDSFRRIPSGARQTTTEFDGLYHYTAEERLTAGEFLYGVLRNIGRSEFDGAQIFFGTLAGIPRDIANQVVNCFSLDLCIDDEHELGDGVTLPDDHWRTATIAGETISPDDVLWWDGPDQGGVYGYSEPLSFRLGYFSQEYTWQVPDGFGTLEVTVLNGGVPVEGASVDAQIAGIFGTTDRNGLVTFVVPAGQVIVLAHVADGNVIYRADGTATVVAGQTTELTIHLEEGSDPNFRKVFFFGEATIVDDESVGNNNTVTVPITNQVYVTPIQNHARVRLLDTCVGNEVVVRVEADVAFNEDDRSVTIISTHTMWERRECRRRDQADRAVVTTELAEGETVFIDEDGTAPFEVYLENTERNGGDYARITVQVSNLVGP